MTSLDTVLQRPVWRYWVKGRPVRTDAPVRWYEHGALEIPPAAIAALDFPERIHLFVAEHEPGLLWICPALADDATAYRINPRRQTGVLRPRHRDDLCHNLTVVGLGERIGVDPNLEVALGEWTVEDDRIVVRFSTGDME